MASFSHQTTLGYTTRARDFTKSIIFETDLTNGLRRHAGNFMQFSDADTIAAVLREWFDLCPWRSYFKPFGLFFSLFEACEEAVAKAAREGITESDAVVTVTLYRPMDYMMPLPHAATTNRFVPVVNAWPGLSVFDVLCGLRNQDEKTRCHELHLSPWCSGHLPKDASGWNDVIRAREEAFYASLICHETVPPCQNPPGGAALIQDEASPS